MSRARSLRCQTATRGKLCTSMIVGYRVQREICDQQEPREWGHTVSLMAAWNMQGLLCADTVQDGSHRPNLYTLSTSTSPSITPNASSPSLLGHISRDNPPPTRPDHYYQPSLNNLYPGPSAMEYLSNPPPPETNHFDERASADVWGESLPASRAGTINTSPFPWNHPPHEPRTNINGGTFISRNVTHIQRQGETGEYSSVDIEVWLCNEG